MGERTGSRVFQWVWSYVIVICQRMTYIMAVISIDVSRNGCDERDPTSSGYHAESSPEHRNECLIELQITVLHRPALHKYQQVPTSHCPEKKSFTVSNRKKIARVYKNMYKKTPL
ncbi:hypothetical protein B0T13DRAFT_210279 [Neurospora crassa]|nr:hypothetical protein B0T13DRAFT_210279 [Neurospora crassa]